MAAMVKGPTRRITSRRAESTTTVVVVVRAGTSAAGGGRWVAMETRETSQATEGMSDLLLFEA
jgi:hypothetical protein